MTESDSSTADFATGDATGIRFPAHPDALRAAGADFLTEAFRAFGCLSPDNAVTCIARIEPCAAGNSGQKLFLSVDYARDEPGLHRDLFVKFSRDFGEPFRDRRRDELAAEVRLATLSRLPAFPVDVAAACFADFEAATGTGILITERIAFGRDGIEPLRRKCMDHELADPLAHYRATVTALARLAAAHHAGRLSPDVERLFPFDRQAAAADLPVPWTRAQLREKVAGYADFAARCPGLLPANLRTPDFIARLERDVLRFFDHEAAVRRFLHADDDLIALCHWNSNIDNAWFWRDAAETMHCGLLDWGMVRQMNVAYGLWGGLSAADLALWDGHGDELLGLFVRELAVGGGPSLEPATLRLHFDLSVALLCLALMIDCPALVLARVPEAVGATGPIHAILGGDQIAHGFFHVFRNCLNLWDRHDFGASLHRMLAHAD